MTYHIFKLSPTTQSYLILLFTLAYVTITLFGLTNGFEGFDIPVEYQPNR